MRLVITDEALDSGQPDSRAVTPDDVSDAFAGLIADHRVEEAVLVTADAEGNLLLLNTDMTNTELVGFVTIATSNYIHEWQHDSGEEDEGAA